MVKLAGEGPVVVVDDNRDALRLAMIVLRESRVPNEVVLLDSGTALLEYLNGVSAGHMTMPGIVLLDINMPEPNGHETLSVIRGQDQFRVVPPIIMLTASDNEDDMKRALEAGADGYQVKPFGFYDFVTFVSGLMQ